MEELQMNLATFLSNKLTEIDKIIKNRVRIKFLRNTTYMIKMKVQNSS